MQHLDFETRSEVNVDIVGTWAYAMHPSTDVIAIGYGPDKDHVTVVPREAARERVAALEDADVVGAHAAHFEVAIWEHVLHRKYGWRRRWDPAGWSCTMARAAVCGLPLGLGPLAEALKTDVPKDLEGRAVMLALSRPLHIDPVFGAVYNEDSAAYARMYAYNRVDVLAEMAVDPLLPKLSAFERRVWELDLEMNRRGVKVDLEFCRRAAGMSNRLVVDLNRRLHEKTCSKPAICTVKTCEGVDKASRVAAIKDFLSRRYNIEAPSLGKEQVTTLLEDPAVHPDVKEILVLRRQVGKVNSIAKYTAALELTCPTDGRARGMFQHSAAHTRRWGGRGIQPQNFPKGLKEKEQHAVIEDVMTLTPIAFAAKYGIKAMDMLSDTLRGMIVAEPGNMLVCADFNAIEARVLFWLAGVVRALNAYARGESPYLEMAATIFKRAVTKADALEYFVGKETILGAGFGMGPETFRLNVYKKTAQAGRPMSLEPQLCEAAIKGYRDKYPEIRNLWYQVEATAVNAVRDPSRQFHCAGGRVTFGMTPDRRFLACRLPSGEYLRYHKPFLRVKKTPWGEEREALHYWGVNPDTKQWSVLDTYGGKLVENIVQAIARDLIANGMLNVQDAGYDVVLTVHDEAGSEFSPLERAPGLVLEEYIKLLCRTPAWALGCPIAAEGWVRERYGK